MWEWFRAARRAAPTTKAAIARLFAVWAPQPPKAVRYGASLRKLLLYAWPSSGAVSQDFFLHGRLAQKVQADIPRQRAFPATPFLMAKILLSSVLSAAARFLFLFLFLFAARWADFRVARVRVYGGLVRADFPHSKADPLGTMPRTVFVRKNPFFKTKALKAARLISYALALRLLRRVCARMSLHSFRRGAVSELSVLVSLRRAARLTGHRSGAMRDERGIRVYAPPRPDSQASRELINLSGRLWAKVAEALRKQRAKTLANTKASKTH